MTVRRPLFTPWRTLSGLVAIDVGRGPEAFLPTVHGPLIAEHHARQQAHHYREPIVLVEEVERARLLAEMVAEAGGGRRSDAGDV